METTSIDLENKFTYFQPIPKLEDIACLAVALKTWDYYYSHCRKMRYEYNKLEKVHEIIHNIEVPKRIEEKIRTVCGTINEKMSHHRYEDIIKMCNCDEYKRKPFFDTIDRSTQDSDDSKQRSFFPYGFVWDSNGNINDKKTAEKALSCPRRLNDNDLMFTIIAQYCLENYIEDFPISSLSEKFLKHVDKGSLREHRMTDYWIKYKRKSTDPNTINSNFYFNRAHTSLFNGLKSADQKIDWPVYEHFWNFFDQEDQLKMAGNFIQYLWYQKYQMILFSKLTRYQLKRIYLEQPVIIILNFFAVGEEELAKAAWERVMSVIGGKRFEDLFGMIRCNEQRSRDDTVQFLIYLWNSATDDLVEYIAIEKECHIADDVISSSSICESPCTVEFLKAVFSRTTPEIRQYFFRNIWLDSLLKDSHSFDSLIEHCLSSSEQQEIKERILINEIEYEYKSKILTRFSNLVYSNLDEFYKYLMFFTTNPDLQKRLKIRLLRSRMLYIKGIWRAENWTKLFKFIDELYYSNPEVANRKKRKIVFSFWRENGNYMDIYRPNGDEKFTEVDNLLTQCLTPEEIRISKKEIIDHFQQLFYRPYYNYHYIPKYSLKRMNIPRFVSWCYCGDEVKVEQFRSTFRIHEAFHSLMREIVERYINGRDACLSFSSLEELISWKFSTKRKKIKKLKRRNIHNIMRSEMKEDYLWKKYKYPYVIKKIIIWAFDGDKSKIREFKQLYQREDLMKIIHWLQLDEETTDCAEYYGHTSDQSE